MSKPELTDQQKNYFEYLQTKALPFWEKLNIEKIENALDNIEWNAKKFLGEVEDETIDLKDYVDRTFSDFTTLTGGLPPDAEHFEFAEEVVDKIYGFFGIEPEIIDPLAFCEKLNEEQGSQYKDWKVSVTELIALLGKKWDLSSRKQYALNFGYPKAKLNKAGTAHFNIWLHGQILNAIKNNGGIVPKELEI